MGFSVSQISLALGTVSQCTGEQFAEVHFSEVPAHLSDIGVLLTTFLSLPAARKA